MTAPTYFGRKDRDAYLHRWAGIVRESFGLHAALAFERMIQDLHAAKEVESLTVRDLQRDIEFLRAELEKLRGW
jgi:hypothetical protein